MAGTEHIPTNTGRRLGFSREAVRVLKTLADHPKLLMLRSLLGCSRREAIAIEDVRDRLLDRRVDRAGDS